MAKTSMIEKEKQKIFLIAKYANKRNALRAVLQDQNATPEDKWRAQKALQKLPIKSHPCRLQTRCSLTGRPRAVYRRFGLCRNALKTSVMFGNIPGVKKASW